MGDLEWAEVVRRLADSNIFWLHTTGLTGAPDAAPVWGVTVDDVLYSLEPRRALLWARPDTEASTRRWQSGD